MTIKYWLTELMFALLELSGHGNLYFRIYARKSPDHVRSDPNFSFLKKLGVSFYELSRAHNATVLAVPGAPLLLGE